MAKEIIMPKFGFTQEESEILEWLVEEGQLVEEGDPVAVVSTDKISMEVEAPISGKLAGMKYQVGDVVPVTETIAYILKDRESLPEEAAETSIEKPKVFSKEAKPDKGKKPDVQISPIAKKMIDQAGVDSGKIKGSGSGGKILKSDVEEFLENKPSHEGRVRATPAARRIALENNIDLSDLQGSGPGGRIQAADVEKLTRPLADSYVELEGGVIPLEGMRKTIAENMQYSFREIPHMTLQVDVVFDQLEALREKENAGKPKQERISITAYITKAVALAISKHPMINSQLREDGINLIADINVGIATALENGLIVPVIHNADRKKVSVLSNEIKLLSERARNGRLKSQDLSGGTFTISNLGMFGIDRFSAIINPPQAAILAVGKMNRRFVPTDENLPIIQKNVTLTLSADHRILDGALAAKFLYEVKEIIESAKEIL